MYQASKGIVLIDEETIKSLQARNTKQVDEKQFSQIERSENENVSFTCVLFYITMIQFFSFFLLLLYKATIHPSEHVASYLKLWRVSLKCEDVCNNCPHHIL